MNFTQLFKTYRTLSSSIGNVAGKGGHECAPLSLAQCCSVGRKKVCKVTGDRKLCAKMASMGVFPGEEIEILDLAKGSQFLLRIQGGTISLDAALGDNIIIESI